MNTAQQLTDLIKAKKPNWVNGNVMAVLLVLIDATKNVEQTWPALLTISKRAAVSESTAKRAVEALKKHSWIRVKSGKRSMRSNYYEILWANLPVYVMPKELVVTEQATKLAESYKDRFIKDFTKYKNRKGYTCHRPLPKNWLIRWPYVLQQKIDRYGFDEVRRLCKKVVADWLNHQQRRAYNQFIAGPQGLPWHHLKPLTSADLQSQQQNPQPGSAHTVSDGLAVESQSIS